MQHIFEAFSKTLLWLSLNSFFGLLSALIALFLNSINLETQQLTLNKILEEGVLIFFCISLCCSVIVDFLFTKHQLPNLIIGAIILIPSVMMLFGSLIFTELYFHKGKNMNYKALFLYQNLIFLTSMLYCLSMKTYLFLKEEERTLEQPN